jgi:hypothetical protein
MTFPPCFPGFRAIGIFFVFGAVMATYAGYTLSHPGTLLDRAWAINRPAHEQLLQFGRGLGLPFFVLAMLLALAAAAWFGRRRWGWALGTGLVAANLLGDFINIYRGDLLKGGFGIVIAGSLLIYLAGTRVREYFR